MMVTVPFSYPVSLLLAGHRLIQFDLDLAAHEPLEVLILQKRSVHTGRRDLQIIVLLDGVSLIQLFA